MGLAGKRNEFVDGIRDNVVVLEVKLRSCVLVSKASTFTLFCIIWKVHELPNLMSQSSI